MAEIINLAEIQEARRKARARGPERENLERALGLMRENLAAIAAELVNAPQVEHGELIMRIERLLAAPEKGRAALCVSGAIGGFDGPAMLYPRLGLTMPREQITVARLNYRAPNEFGECLVDAMAALTFLGGIGHERVALIGHSFGGAVAINAGTLSPLVTTVIALSSQLAGAHVAGELAPKPLLLIHGNADTILPHESSQALYDRAGEPKTIKILPGVSHRLSEAADEVL